MKKLIIRYTGFVLCLIVVFAVLIRLVPDRFYTSYQRAVVNQHDYLRSIKDEEKIICVGNSSLVMGLDIDKLSELTGKKTAVLGNQISFGYPVFIEICKEYMKAGDTVIIEITDLDYWDVGMDMNLTGMGRRYDLYRFIPARLRGEALKRFPPVLLKNIEYVLNRTPIADGPYSMKGFDERGNYVYPREDCVLSDPYQGEGTWTDFSDCELDPELIDALNEFIEECEEKGVTVYLTHKPFCRDVIIPETLTE